ncbi:unnamed protein product [Adineta ricciae]|uniref:Uncharacterized protein n=1 Tax=Adineta ricciae TaxID=249248 RepID=A0A814R4B1_ADIRI|nr:unnamed protein product [Adineta ricciae]
MSWLIYSTSSFRRYDWKRRFRKHLETKTFNLTDVHTTSSTSQTRLFSTSNGTSKFTFILIVVFNFFHLDFTRTQIKVIVTVVLIISFIMIIIAIFRFRNACRHREEDNPQTDILRARAAQYNEPSSRRGSVGVSLQDDFVCKEL